MSLTGYNPLATSFHAYDKVKVNNIPIVGTKLHRDQDILHIYGFCFNKRVIIPGNYPPDNRHLKTIAKDDLRALTPLGSFVQFKLCPGRFYKISVDGITAKEDDVIRYLENNLVYRYYY